MSSPVDSSVVGSQKSSPLRDMNALSRRNDMTQFIIIFFRKRSQATVESGLILLAGGKNVRGFFRYPGENL